MRNKNGALMPLVIIFTMISGLLVVFSKKLQSAGFDTDVLIYANIILFSLSVISYFMQARGLKNSNPNVFIRSVMGGMIMKMFACIIAVFIYVQSSGGDYNRKAIFTALCLYLVYLAVEVSVVMKLNKRKNA